MIVDGHTHAFPPELIERRQELLAQEPVFAELYATSRAKLATAEQVLQEMDTAGVDVSVVAGFAWRDPARCRQHNEYLLRAAAASGGRLLPFCTLPLSDPDAARLEVTRCVRSGARGLGELRPESQGASLQDPALADVLAWAAAAYELPLLVHASEPVGHPYPGKGGQSLGPLYEFILDHPQMRLILAHWGGGLPFFALMPEVRAALANVCVDTAATGYLYESAVFRTVADLIGYERILFGSDFPLLRQRGQIELIASAPLSTLERTAVLGGNAARVLNLSEEVA